MSHCECQAEGRDVRENDFVFLLLAPGFVFSRALLFKKPLLVPQKLADFGPI